jgi:hypothetical protein
VKVRTEDSIWVTNRLANIGITGARVEELLDSAGKPRKVLMASHSLQQVAQHMGDESVFAVAYTLTLQGEDTTRADGVTTCPLGKKWLALGLECTGISSMGLRLRAEEEPTIEEMTQIMEIKKLLERPSLQHKSNKLWTCVDSLFHTWILPTTYDHQELHKSEGTELTAAIRLFQDSDIVISEGAELTAAVRLFQGLNNADTPIKAKRLTPTAVPEEKDASGGWWTSTKK